MSDIDPGVMEAARTWAAEHELGHDPDSGEKLDDAGILAAVRKHYVGGLDRFTRDHAPAAAGAATEDGDKAWKALARNGWNTRTSNEAVVQYRNARGRLTSEKIDVAAVPRRMKALADLGVRARAYNFKGQLVGGVDKRGGRLAGW